MALSGASLPSQNVNVSVVIPCYNRREYVGRAVDSVLAQTYPEFELIVVDDGSTDGGGDVVRQYSDSRVRLISQANAGECGARNRGVAESRGEWVAFLDSDDEWLPEFLDGTMRVVQSHPLVCAVFTNLRNAHTGRAAIGEDVPGGVLHDYLAFVVSHGQGMSSSSVLVRKETLLEAGGFPTGVRYGGDTDTWTRLYWTARTVAYLPEALAVYHTEAAGRVMEDGVRAYCNCYDATLRSCRQWQEQGRIPEELLESTSRYVDWVLLRYANLLTDAGAGDRAREVLRKRCSPGLIGRWRWWHAYFRSVVPRGLTDCCRKLRDLAASSQRGASQ